MIDYHAQLVQGLNTILPTYYENIQDAEIQMPCITYVQYDQYDTYVGTSMKFGYISFRVKVWGESIREVNQNSIKVARKMQDMGFKLVSTNEMAADGLIQKIMVYSGTSFEIEKNILAKEAYGGK